MKKPQFLIYAVIVTVAGALLVGWGAVFVVNVEGWFPVAVQYLAIAFVSLVLLIAISNRYDLDILDSR